MKKTLYSVIAGIVLVLAVVITLIILFNNLTKKSFYSENGIYYISGISDTVKIFKDDFGVSHIIAGNEEDMFFAQGYIHAQDRLFQMDLYRRVCEGRMSEIFGKETLDYDKLFRTLRINHTAENLYEHISQKSKDILKSYSDGVNYFIKTHSKNLPLEFDLLDYKPEEWTPVNSLMLVRMLGWELNLSWYSDYMFGEIVKKLGLDRARDFFPNYPEDAPFIVKSESKKESSDKVQKPSAENINPQNINPAVIEDNFKTLAALGTGFFQSSVSFRKYMGIEGSHIGSNAWVISGTKSENRKPILANDPHLSLTVPSKWYEIQLYNENDGTYVSGFSIPGAPCVVIGQNNNIAWGITNLMNDDSEFYILERDSTDRNKYVLKGNSFPIDSSSEDIKIKGIREELTFVTHRTKIGPVISELEKTNPVSNQNFKRTDDKILTFRWTGYESSDELKAIYDVNNSKNWNDFKSALKNFGLPASNFVYADTEGNIGYHAAGLVPIRKNLLNEFEVFYPSAGEVEWSGFINSDDLPQSYNPKDSFVVTANNKPQKDYKYYISNLYEPPYRAERIESILKSRNNFNAGEFKLIQSDVYGLQAKEYCKYIFEAFKDTLNLKDDERTFIRLLKNWDFNFSNFSVQASFISEFEIQLYKNLYLDKLGDEIFKSYLVLNNIPVRNTSKVLKDDKNWLFDFPATVRKLETRDDMMRKTFHDAIESLKTKFGTNDFQKWYWGEIHKVIMEHPFGIVSSLSSIVNIGPNELGGSGTTVACSEYSFIKALNSKEFESTLGQSMKYITDLSDTRSYLSVLPTGQSGQPLHYNYRDQNRLWLNGEYKTVTTNLQELNSGNYKLLYLIPE